MRITIKNKEEFISMFNSIYKDINITKINGLTIDSRKVEKNDIYFPITGSKFDGHKFIESSLESGAILSFSEKKSNNIKIIQTKSVRNELYKLSKEWSSRSKSKIIGITGSNGKTTAKNLIYNIIKKQYKCSKTEGNYNSTLGLPLSYLSSSLYDDFCILEYGASKPNEIEFLCRIVKPFYSYITNISNAHIENYKSLNQIFETKTAIYKYTNDKGISFIDSSNIKINKDIIQSDIIDLKYDTKAINSPKHLEHINDIIQSIYKICMNLNIEESIIKDTIRSFNMPKGRGNILKYKDYDIIDDSYNANPKSTKLAIHRLDKIKIKGKKIIILGDMLELGTHDIYEHEKIAELINISDIDIILTYGNLAKYTSKKIKNKYSKHYTNMNKLRIELNSIVNKQDLIYLKGSRFMQLEQVYKDIL